jgi:hypothetical protein
MKANQRLKLKDDHGYFQVIGGIVALLIFLVIGVMLYFNVSEGVDEFGIVVETFGPYADTTNGSAWTVTLENSPVNIASTNVTCCNISAGVDSWPTFTLNFKTVRAAADAANNFTQVNVTYTSNIASLESGNTNMAGTVFTLAPIIALVVVAVVLLGVILTFGKGKRGGF